MFSLMAIARATLITALGATSLFGQVYQGAVIARPTTPTTVLRQPTLVQPLAGPTNLTVTPAGIEATVRWDPVPGVTGYLVTRTSAQSGTIQQTPTPITSTSFTDVSQQFDPRYLHTYQVLAVYPDGRSGASTVTYLPPPPRVSLPQHVGNRYVGATGWNTTWVAVPEATGYAVRYQLDMTDGNNAYWLVDTTFVVAAPATSHWVGEWNGLKGLGNAPTSIRSAAVSAVFPNGARSAATPAQ
jgi:hypothetical protein